MSLLENNKIGILYTMQGLGDHIMFNGMARRLLLEHSLTKIYVVSWRHYSHVVTFMYRDNPRIQVISIDSGNEHIGMIEHIKSIVPDTIYLLGHEIQRGVPGRSFDEFLHHETQQYQVSWSDLSTKSIYGNQAYYDFMEIDWKHRFMSFYYERDMQAEEQLFNMVNPNHEEYIFIHHDPTRGFTMDTNKLLDIVGKDIKIISAPTMQNNGMNILHFGMVLQNAKQFHAMSSSFACLVEGLDMDYVDLYMHQYIRNAGRFVRDGKTCPSETRKPWTVIF